MENCLVFVLPANEKLFSIVLPANGKLFRILLFRPTGSCLVFVLQASPKLFSILFFRRLRSCLVFCCFAGVLCCIGEAAGLCSVSADCYSLPATPPSPSPCPPPPPRPPPPPPHTHPQAVLCGAGSSCSMLLYVNRDYTDY